MGVRLLFGAVGLTVALIAAWGMNALLDTLNARTLLAGTQVLLFDTEDELVERLQEAGAQFGDPQFSLAWNNRNDLDLHVIDPAGNHIYFQQRISPTGGKLDVDANANRLRTTERPVENIYWPPGDAPAGVYTVYVHHYANHGAPDPTPYTLRVTINGRTREFRNSLRYRQESRRITIDPRTVEGWNSLPAKRISWMFVVMGGWGAALGLALALALRLPQAFFVRHEAYDPRAFGVGCVLVGALGGTLLGALAGVLGQALFGWFCGLGEGFARLIGLAVLGGLLGYGLAHCIPNLPVNPARWAGAIGGTLGWWAYGWALQHSSDATGRCLVATLLGLAIGLMITLNFWAIQYALVRSGGTIHTQRIKKAYRLKAGK